MHSLIFPPRNHCYELTNKLNFYYCFSIYGPSYQIFQHIAFFMSIFISIRLLYLLNLSLLKEFIIHLNSGILGAGGRQPLQRKQGRHVSHIVTTLCIETGNSPSYRDYKVFEVAAHIIIFIAMDFFFPVSALFSQI